MNNYVAKLQQNVILRVLKFVNFFYLKTFKPLVEIKHNYTFLQHLETDH